MVVIGTIAFVHEDNRRSIAEFDSPEGGFSVHIFKIKEKIPLGNHYHAEKDEVFVIVGDGMVFFAEVNRDTFEVGYICGEVVTTGSVIKIPAYTAHTFVLKPGSKMLCYSTKPFDKEDLRP